MNKVLMLTPEGEEVDVDEKNFDAALAKGLEPALEYVTPQGETVVVRRKNFNAAEKQGLVMKPLYEARKAPTPSPGKIAAGAYGAAQWTPLGAFREEIAGALESPVGAAQAMGELFGADYKSSPELQKYRKAKEQYKIGEEAAFEQEPAAYSAGGVLGFLTGLSGGAGVLGKAPSAARAAGVGATSGAASGVGESEGDLQELATGGLIGGVSGGALGALGPALSRGKQKAAQEARAQAGRSAYAATGALKSDINRLYQRTPEEIGQELLRSNVVRLGTKRGSDVIPERIQGRLKQFGAGQKQLLSELDEAAPDGFETQKLIDALTERADEARKLPGVGNQALADRLQKEADVLSQVYGGFDELGQSLPPRNISLEQALDLKRAFDKAGRYQSPMSQADAVAAAREARKLANRQLDESVEAIGGKSVADAYRTERRRASLLQDAKKAADEQAKRDQANLTFGLRELLAGGAGATVGAFGGVGGSAAGFAAATALSKLMKNYGSSTTAKMMETAANLIEKEGFQAGVQSLSALYGADAASDLALALIDTGNFKNPEQLTDILGSAVLGSDLTKAVGSLGAGLGYALEGGSFTEGSAERMKEYEENPAKYSGIASTIGAMVPTGKLGKVGSAVVRGVRTLDEMLSETGRQKNAPNVMRIKLPSGDEFPSKVKTGKEMERVIDNLDLGGGNKIRITKVKDDRIEGKIDHPDYPNHTSFHFGKDWEGTWTLNSNFRNNQFADVPELKGSSTRMRQAVAKAVGGIASDSGDSNTRIGQLSYLRDPESIMTRPDLNIRDIGEPRSKFYTPGDEKQREDFLSALEKSYGELPDKAMAREKIEGNARRQIERERTAREERALRDRLFIEGNELRERLLDDPQFEPLREAARSDKQDLIDDYLRVLKSGSFNEIQSIRNRLQPSNDLLTKILKTPEGKRDELKQTEIMNQMLRESRPLERFRTKEGAAYDRIAKQNVQQDLEWFNKYKDSTFSSIPGVLTDAKTNVDQIFRYYEPEQMETLKQDQIDEWNKLSTRAQEAIAEYNYRDIRELNIKNMMRDAAVNHESLNQALRMRRNADLQAFKLFNSNLSPEQMLEKMKPYIDASQGRVGQMRSYDDIHKSRTFYSRLETQTLKDILSDTIDKTAPWYENLETAINKRIIKDIIKRRRRNEQADNAN